MSRARNIKPGLFANEYLADLPFEARLLFIGLWTLADRRGRLEDRPKGIKGRLFPYDDVDVDNLLQKLAGSPERFIVRYSVDGNRYIQVTNFEKHQNPHCREAESIIPPPPDGAQYEHSASVIQALNGHGTSPADSPLLIPDSLNLIPDIPIEDKSSLSAEPPAGSEILESPAAKKIDFEAIKELFNSICVSLPKVKYITKNRQTAIRARFTDKTNPATMEIFAEVFELVEKSEFLSGRDGQWSACCFDWILKPANWTKILEGNYNRGAGKKTDTQAANLTGVKW